MTGESRDGSKLEEQIGLPAAMERAHASGERAALQSTKLLGTVQGGLGVTIAAWLQRIFEQSGHGSLSPLALYLAFALGFVALGLVAVVLTAIIDQRTTYHAVQSLTFNTNRVWVARRRKLARQLQGDEKSAEELACAAEDGELIRKIAEEDLRTNRLNAMSTGFLVGSWGCLIAAFAALGFGIIVMIDCANR
jgi:hypothetical protein